jgi:hypothetical protein
METALEILRRHKQAIKDALPTLKTELENKLEEAQEIYYAIKENDPVFDAGETLRKYGFIKSQAIKATTNKRNEKITVSISNKLTPEGLNEAAIIKALPNIDKKRIQAALDKVKTKPGSKDSFIFKNNLFYPKR